MNAIPMETRAAEHQQLQDQLLCVCVWGGGRVGVEGQEEGGGGGSQWQVGNPSCCLSLCELRGPQP